MTVTQELIDTETEKRSTAITADGYLVDTETGEILSVLIVSESEGDERFEITDQKSAEWLLEKTQDAQLALKSLDEKLAILTENINAMKAEQFARLNFLEYRFGNSLEDWVKKASSGSGKKSVNTMYGRVGFRTTPSKIVPVDVEDAIEWAETHFPDAVKISKRLAVSPLKGHEEELPPELFTVVPPSEKFYIETKVK
jgi:hypothetical protein